MPRILEKTVYKFDELSDKAKEKARDWYRQFVFSDSNDWEHVYSDAAAIAELMGIDIATRGKHNEPIIYFSGFSSQGDGACFEGSYRYKKGSVKAVKDYAPQDTELHRIVKTLADIQRKNFYRLYATMSHRGPYYHSGCMSVNVEDSENQYRDIGDAENEITQLMRDFADWIYDQLEKENDYQSEDETIDENIRANEYEFDEDGGRA